MVTAKVAHPQPSIQDHSHEQAVLGGCFRAAHRAAGDLLDGALVCLQAEDFEPQHRAILGAARDLRLSDRWPTLPEVTDALRRRGDLDQISGDVPGPDGELVRARGALYLTALLHATFTDALLPHDVRDLKRSKARHTAARLAEALTEAAQRGRPLEDLASTARLILAAVEP